MGNFKKDFRIRYGNLYEILATTFSTNKMIKKVHPNTSCMGIRLKENDHFIIGPYPTTQTFQNLSSNKLIILNFVNNIYLYALAALKDPHSKINLNCFPEKYYDYINKKTLKELQSFIPNELKNKHQISYIKNAWGIIIGYVIDKEKKEKKDGLGKVNITEFIIKPIYTKIFRFSQKLYNRAESLSLEMIILATRLKVAYDKADMALISSLWEKINQYEINIRRFSKNQRVIKTIDLVKKYISSLR